MLLTDHLFTSEPVSPPGQDLRSKRDAMDEEERLSTSLGTVGIDGQLARQSARMSEVESHAPEVGPRTSSSAAAAV